MSPPVKSPAETIAFESGNPDTPYISHGTIDIEPFSSSSPTSVVLLHHIPGLMTPADFCTFLKSSFDSILHFRTIRLRTEHNRYVVVVNLKDSSHASPFVRTFTGKPYLRGLVTEPCIIRTVLDIRFDKASPSDSSLHVCSRTSSCADEHLSDVSHAHTSMQIVPPVPLSVPTSTPSPPTTTVPAAEKNSILKEGNSDTNIDISKLSTICTNENANADATLSSNKTGTSNGNDNDESANVQENEDNNSSSRSDGCNKSKAPCATVLLPSASQGPPETHLAFPHSAMFPPALQDLDASQAQHFFCPVCLERLDALQSPLVTLFCNHTMHAACLAQWDTNRCPVCRHVHELAPETTVCMRCDEREGLWMCLVCAFVGCGVYQEKHADEHFRTSHHPFAVSLVDSTFWSGDKLRAGVVWDYISERFVNRLVNSDDGKVVEIEGGGVVDGVSSAGGGASSSGQNDVCCSSTERAAMVGDEDYDRSYQAALYASRMDAVAHEYRIRMERMEDEHAERVRLLEEETKRLRREIGESVRERKAIARKLGEADKEMKGLRDKNGFLKSLNETLLRDKKAWSEEVERMKTKASEAEAAKTGLEEQLRDLMMHLETQASITSGAGSSGDNCRSDVSELHGGDVVRVGPSRRQRLAMKTNRRYGGS